MTEEEEEQYVFAQDLTRLCIARDVLSEIIHDDFKVKSIVTDLQKQIDKAFHKMENQ